MTSLPLTGKNIFCYDEMKAMLLKKYPKYDSIMADRALNYFQDVKVDLIPSIKMIDEKLDFNKIKTRLLQMTENPMRVFATSPLCNKPCAKKQIHSPSIKFPK